MMKVTMLRSLFLGMLLSIFSVAIAVEVGDSIPSIELHHNFPPNKINLADRLANKRAIIVGLPGAFTPT
jgi:2-Cys peroxiredoxin 5